MHLKLLQIQEYEIEMCQLLNELLFVYVTPLLPLNSNSPLEVLRDNIPIMLDHCLESFQVL